MYIGLSIAMFDYQRGNLPVLMLGCDDAALSRKIVLLRKALRQCCLQFFSLHRFSSVISLSKSEFLSFLGGGVLKWGYP